MDANARPRHDATARRKTPLRHRAVGAARRGRTRRNSLRLRTQQCGMARRKARLALQVARWPGPA
eukprot:4127408-Lingulodinium_polyedra.AAC.1